MKNYINENHLKEWEFSGKNSWAKIYTSSFKGQIIYEKDGVLTCSLNNCMDNDFFEEYTITSPKHFNIKLKFLQTALYQLFYKIITEEEFMELLNII